MFCETGRPCDYGTREAGPRLIKTIFFIDGLFQQLHRVVLFTLFEGRPEHRRFDGQHSLFLFINIEPDITVPWNKHQEWLDSNFSEGRGNQNRPIHAVRLRIIQALFNQSDMLAGNRMCLDRRSSNTAVANIPCDQRVPDRIDLANDFRLTLLITTKALNHSDIKRLTQQLVEERMLFINIGGKRKAGIQG